MMEAGSTGLRVSKIGSPRPKKVVFSENRILRPGYRKQPRDTKKVVHYEFQFMIQHHKTLFLVIVSSHFHNDQSVKG